MVLKLFDSCVYDYMYLYLRSYFDGCSFFRKIKKKLRNKMLKMQRNSVLNIVTNTSKHGDDSYQGYKYYYFLKFKRYIYSEFYLR